MSQGGTGNLDKNVHARSKKWRICLQAYDLLTVNLMRRILLLEDNVAYAKFLETMLQEEGFAVSSFTCPMAALAALEIQSFSLILTDLSLPGIGGLNLVEQLHSAAPETPIIVMSGYYFPTMLDELREAGAVEAVGKPCRFEQLLATLKPLAKPLQRLEAVC